MYQEQAAVLASLILISVQKANSDAILISNIVQLAFVHPATITMHAWVRATGKVVRYQQCVNMGAQSCSALMCVHTITATY
jgi:hypothetical protein